MHNTRNKTRTGVFGAGWGRAAAEGPRRFCLSLRASVSVEAVCCLFFSIGVMAGVFELGNTLLMGDVLDRAARAVARDNSLQVQAAPNKEKLLARARDAIRKEVGGWLDADVLKVDIKAYDNPSTMLQGTASTGGNALLGGDAGDMVVVRLRYELGTPLAGLRELFQAGESGSLAFRALAVARNEGVAESHEPEVENLQVSGR